MSMLFGLTSAVVISYAHLDGQKEHSDAVHEVQKRNGASQDKVRIIHAHATNIPMYIICLYLHV